MMGPCCSRFEKRIDEFIERHPIEVMRRMQTKRCPMFWILGGPCSGKTTLCSRLSRRFHFRHINLEQLLREDLTKSQHGNVTEEDVDLRLLPREYVLSLIQQEVLAHCLTSRGFLLEGYPQSLSQAEELIREVGPPSIIFYFHASLRAMKRRLRHERPFLARVGLEEEASYVKIYTFMKYFYPLQLKFKDKTVRLDTDGDLGKIFVHLVSIFNRFLKQKKIRIPNRRPLK